MTNMREQVPAVMESFDFEKVQKVMEFLNWTWHGSSSVPTIKELKDCAAYLLNGCIDMFEDQGRPKTGMIWATGGFKAIIVVYDSQIELNLLFYVESRKVNV